MAEKRGNSRWAGMVWGRISAAEEQKEVLKLQADECKKEIKIKHTKTRWNQRLNACLSKPEIQINHSQLKTHIDLGPNIYLSDKYMNDKYMLHMYLYVWPLKYLISCFEGMVRSKNWDFLISFKYFRAVVWAVSARAASLTPHTQLETAASGPQLRHVTCDVRETRLVLIQSQILLRTSLLWTMLRWNSWDRRPVLRLLRHMRRPNTSQLTRKCAVTAACWRSEGNRRSISASEW